MLLSPDNERLPLPLGINEGAAFDHGLGRAGWVAVQVGYQVIALRDGDLLRSTRLPECWSISPAADPSLVLARRYFGDSRRDGEAETIELVDSTGRVVRSVSADVWGVLGELRSGVVVARDSLVSWAGDRSPLPAAGYAQAVVAGRFVVMHDPDAADPQVVRVIDTETARERTCPLPQQRSLISPSYDTTASSVAFGQFDSDEIFVVTASGVPRWIPVGLEPHSVVWLDVDHVSLFGDRGNCVVDVRSGAVSELFGVPRNAYPRLDVSDRFEPEQLRAALQPRWKGPIPDHARDAHTARARQLIRQAAEDVAMPADALLAVAASAIRLRSCLPPKRVPVGASRLGGQPDLPRGRKWPMFNAVPMAFLAQLRCNELSAALPHVGLPTDGMLVVFVALEPDGGYPPTADSVLVEVVPTRGLKRLSWPSDLPEELRFSTSLAVAEPTLVLPDWPTLHALAPDAAQQVLDAVRTPGSTHQLLGHANMIQENPPPDGCRLLLQIDSDPLIGTVFGDGGRLHIWSPATASPLGALDACTVELDCY